MLNNPEILERALQREKRSREYRQRYLNNQDNEKGAAALREFCQNDPFALDTEWVKTAITTAMLTGDDNFLKRLFVPGRGKRAGKGRVAMMIENLIIFDVCNQLAADEGLPFTRPEAEDEDKEKAPETVFDVVCMRQLLTFGKAQGFEPSTIFNRYYKAKRQIPDVMIEKLFNGTIVRMGPAKIEMNQAKIYGIHEIFYPDDGMEKIVNVRAVFNTYLTK